MQESIDKIIRLLVNELLVDEKVGKLNVEELSKQLLNKGFEETEIQKALKHLLMTLDVGAFPGKRRQVHKSPPPIRMLIPEEMQFFNADAHGYLIQLQALALVDALQVEQIIERCFLMGLNRVELDDLKMVVSQFLLGKELGTFETDAVYYPGNDRLN